jgi:hypothetical protein
MKGPGVLPSIEIPAVLQFELFLRAMFLQFEIFLRVMSRFITIRAQMAKEMLHI